MANTKVAPIDHANRVFIHSIYGKYALIIDNSKGGLGTEVNLDDLVNPEITKTPVFKKGKKAATPVKKPETVEEIPAEEVIPEEGEIQ